MSEKNSEACYMLSGEFENCYGLRKLSLPDIDFAKTNKANKAIIYAPNGVMKSSLANVFSDISKGAETRDRIFKDAVCRYSVKYCKNVYEYSSDNNKNKLNPTDRIYVINTFADSFEFTKETVGILLADEETRKKYNDLMGELSEEINQIVRKLNYLTRITKPKIKGKLIEDLNLDDTADWTDIFEEINKLMNERQIYSYLNYINYSELFNDKVMKIYADKEFINTIDEYISSLKSLLVDNPVLNEHFTDYDANELSANLSKHNLFSADHTIVLKDGVTVVHTLDKWKKLVKEQVNKLYENPELKDPFQKLDKILTANSEANDLRDIIVKNREIIPALKNINELKKQTWLDCFSKLDKPFADYYDIISKYTSEIHQLYKQAATQSKEWQDVVDEFNRRFRVPFKILIENKANFILKDEAPSVTFEYKRGQNGEQAVTLKKDELMLSLSTGEKRALYLLYILFDLEKIRQKACAEDHYLIVADDIVDSFDYKNKYAIIEYLSELGKKEGIDLLILTHNFDFYRTVCSRLEIEWVNAYIAQRDENDNISVTKFGYRNDFFKRKIINNIKNGEIQGDEIKKLLISSIPFYRNIYEYSGRDEEYMQLTCFLHLKTTPLNTMEAKISDLWNIINQFLKIDKFFVEDEGYYSAINRIAEQCANGITNEVSLDNKLVLAIATRLHTEIFLKKVMENNGICAEEISNQTGKWSEKASIYLTKEQKQIIEEVNLMTPESIHLNSFMFEPLIDISDWALKELYKNVLKLK